MARGAGIGKAEPSTAVTGVPTRCAGRRIRRPMHHVEGRLPRVAHRAGGRSC